MKHKLVTPKTRISKSMASQGYAIIIVLLFASAILISMLSSSFFSAIGARRGSANDQGSYQALLIAESGLDSFPGRYATATTLPTTTVANYTAGGVPIDWGTSGLGSYSLDGNTSTLVGTGILSSSQRKILRLQSTSSTTTTGTKVVVRDFLAPDPNQSFGNPGAALMVFDASSIGGNYSATGVSVPANTTNTTTTTTTTTAVSAVSSTPTATSTATTLTFRYTGGPGLVAGDKTQITIGGVAYTFTVNSVVTTGALASRTMTLSAPTPAATLSTLATALNTGGAGTTIYKSTTTTTTTTAAPTSYGLVSPQTINSGATSSVLQLSSVSPYVGVIGLRVDSANPQPITVTDTGVSLTGTITGISGNNVTVAWNPVPTATANLTAATGTTSRVYPTVPSIIGMSTVSSTGSSTATPALIQNTGLFPDSQTMFEYFFGTTKSQMQTSSAVSTIAAGSFNPALSNAVYNGKKVIYAQGDVTISGGGANQLCGTGYTLIVDGNLSISGQPASNCFNGLIYITGNLAVSGNFAMTGSLVVEKKVTGLGTSSVVFDPAVLSTATSTLPKTAQFAFSPMSNWRQQ